MVLAARRQEAAACMLLGRQLRAQGIVASGVRTQRQILSYTWGTMGSTAGVGSACSTENTLALPVHLRI